MMNIHAISLVGFPNYKFIQSFIEAYPEARFELAYNMSVQFLEEITPLLRNRVVSLHACCPLTPFFPNFASRDAKVLADSEKDLQRSVSTAHAFGASVIVLHPGYLTDRAMPSGAASRLHLLADKAFLPFIGVEEGSICTREYPFLEAYQTRFSQMVTNLKKLGHSLWQEGISLAVENLNPRAGYLFLTPDEMVKLAEEEDLFLCLDVGHLWISHCVFGFDFFDALHRILSTGKVVSCHLHANPSRDGSKGIYQDTHSSLDAFDFPSDRIVAILSKSNANLVLETLEEPLHNARLLDLLCKASER